MVLAQNDTNLSVLHFIYYTSTDEIPVIVALITAVLLRNVTDCSAYEVQAQHMRHTIWKTNLFQMFCYILYL